jgi:CRP/FNR family cyclic AMP-dependent transcriptional regulator
LSVCAPGELIGELSAVDGLPRSATDRTIDPVVAAHVLPAEECRTFLAGHPDASLSLLASVYARLRDSDRRRVEFAALDSIGRGCPPPRGLAEQGGVADADGALRIDMPITHDDLAG